MIWRSRSLVVLFNKTFPDVLQLFSVRSHRGRLPIFR